MTLSEQIKASREEKGMTQKEVADAMGISQQAYSQYESGKRNPKPETIIKIANALSLQDPLTLFLVDDYSKNAWHKLFDKYGGLSTGLNLKTGKYVTKVYPKPSLGEQSWDLFSELTQEGRIQAVNACIACLWERWNYNSKPIFNDLVYILDKDETLGKMVVDKLEALVIAEKHPELNNKSTPDTDPTQK